MVDEFQAFLLLGLTGLFVYVLMRVVRDDLERARFSRRASAAQNRSQLPPWSEPGVPARRSRWFRERPRPRGRGSRK